MDFQKSKTELFEMQFQELVEKAREIYPNIDEAVATLNNMTAQTNNLQDYLNLTLQTPSEVSNNQISLT